MASRNTITELIAAIKTVYPYFAKGTDVEMLVRVWASLLRDYPDRAVMQAVVSCLRVCKTPPTPADVIEQLEAMRADCEPSDEELWTALVSALETVSVQLYRMRYPLVGEDPHERLEACWQALPARVRQYVGGKSELIRLARRADESELRFERARFLKTMPLMKKHSLGDRNLPPSTAPPKRIAPS